MTLRYCLPLEGQRKRGVNLAGGGALEPDAHHVVRLVVYNELAAVYNDLEAVYNDL